ncbi:hypothetical protein [Streptomyces colonosanans]|uniref:Uncharacterized protein n=1 Tax=Streptomyces colonosanans TaxID=1428652 RepID=A0A1S2P4N8_9ACTN|nr:hypothetical protein [Streptomyces colonosanans]OIJ88405.1 hypothetical protein BIV24_22900 [Streptomyces colonosanans]
MSRQSFRPDPAEREEMARLLPVPAERDLPAGRHQLFKDYLMNEIHHDADPDAAVPARSRRRKAFLAIPLATAVAAGAVFTALATGHATNPVQANQHSSSGQPLKITAAAYTLQQEDHGLVRLAIIDPAGKLDLPGLQRDLDRLGVPARVYAGDPNCPTPADPSSSPTSTPDPIPTAPASQPEVSRTPSGLASEHPASSWRVEVNNGKPVLYVRPDKIPAGQKLMVSFPLAHTEPDHAWSIIEGRTIDGTPPACIPAPPKGAIQFGPITS